MKGFSEDTICAQATPPGIGAIGVIRVSGKDSFKIVNHIFSKNLDSVERNTVHFGTIKTPNGEIIDEVLVTVFKAPHSYTGEDSIEISTHGSPYIIQRVLELLIESGARMAKPGEFTMRAFLNKKLDLSQAEAVADVIASQNEKALQTALNQLRGGFSKKINKLREELIHFASLIELELDFSEEDVEFADRTQLVELIDTILAETHKLIMSFSYGNAIKKGIPIAIIGKPNAGKSTLLNALLNEEKAIVSSIAGTTRDIIEDDLVVNGLNFRFIDTAGIRETTNEIEKIGIERTKEKIAQAEIVLAVLDATDFSLSELEELSKLLTGKRKKAVYIINKSDAANPQHIENILQKTGKPHISLSAKQKENIELLKEKIYQLAEQYTDFSESDTVVTNTRHYEALKKVSDALKKVKEGISMQTPGDLLAMDIRVALFHLGEITGSEITPDDLLGNIFSRFCIGK
ncbi:MAG: tRNA uridine-5-carboxymethylaminomethyl(34) synthesis GTPase MnmE [Bacteroidetes bacterium]|nr:MAG: tRNA uridine-5-carboxymethylaminomethyl(34) synthesis GTPase MnmE [Bacteroidota bacterium]